MLVVWGERATFMPVRAGGLDPSPIRHRTPGLPARLLLGAIHSHSQRDFVPVEVVRIGRQHLPKVEEAEAEVAAADMLALDPRSPGSSFVDS